MGRTGTYEAVVAAPADEVFSTLVDVAHLAEWNRRITRVVETPHVVEAGAEWVVSMRIAGQTFASRSLALEVDAARRRFVHRSSPDGDPDFAIWTWEVGNDPAGARVRVTWDLNPVQWINRRFFVHLRTRQLPTDLERSLQALSSVLSGRRDNPVAPVTKEAIQ